MPKYVAMPPHTGHDAPVIETGAESGGQATATDQRVSLATRRVTRLIFADRHDTLRELADR